MTIRMNRETSVDCNETGTEVNDAKYKEICIDSHSALTGRGKAMDKLRTKFASSSPPPLPNRLDRYQADRN